MANLLVNKKFLIIDDFPAMRSTLKKMVTQCGSQDIDDARDGREAVTHMEHKRYDIILCDYNLGDGKDGQQILEEAKHRKLISYTTIFMMITAENTAEMVMGAMEYAPDGYLTKPFTKAVLQNRLEKIVEKKANLVEIDEAVHQKDLRRAIDLCDAKLAENPKNAFEIYRLKADFCMAVKNYDGAAAVFEQVLSTRDLPWASLGLGQVSYFKKDYVSARMAFQQIIDQNRAFVQAYDWLAKCQEMMGGAAEAQATLEEAARLSPKAILRQKALGELALKNNDLETAEQSYKKAVKIGKTSCFRSANDYTGLARVLVEKKAPAEALKLMGTLRNEFKGQTEATMQAAAMEGVIYTDLGDEKSATQAVKEAGQLFEQMGGTAAPDAAMELAKAYFAVGKTDEAQDVVQYVVKNNHEDEEVLRHAQQLFNDVGMEDVGQSLISSARQEVISINNQGVQLAKEGKLEASIELFDKAVNGMPDNVVINLNAAQSLIMFMQKHGKDDKHAQKARVYLENVGRKDSSNEKYLKLSGLLKKLLTV